MYHTIEKKSIIKATSFINNSNTSDLSLKRLRLMAKYSKMRGFFNLPRLTIPVFTRMISFQIISLTCSTKQLLNLETMRSMLLGNCYKNNMGFFFIMTQTWAVYLYILNCSHVSCSCINDLALPSYICICQQKTI